MEQAFAETVPVSDILQQLSGKSAITTLSLKLRTINRNFGRKDLAEDAKGRTPLAAK